MTLLSTVQSVCAVVGVTRPQSVFANINNNRTLFEMLELANEMAQRIAYNEREWNILKRLAVYTGGVNELPPDFSPPSNEKVASVFPLPQDYKRLLLTANVWRSTSTVSPMLFVSDTDEWTRRRYQNYFDQRGEWAIHIGAIRVAPPLTAIFPDPQYFTGWQNSYPYFVLGDYAKDTFDPANPTLWKVMVKHTSSPAPMQFWQERNAHPDYWESVPITPAQTIHFNYLSKNCVSLASGGAGDKFMADGDTFVLPERLLKLGMIWQWKANKGSPYAEDMANYQTELSRDSGTDKPAPIIIGRLPASAAMQVALPWPPGWGPQQ